MDKNPAVVEIRHLANRKLSMTFSFGPDTHIISICNKPYGCDVSNRLVKLKPHMAFEPQNKIMLKK